MYIADFTARLTYYTSGITRRDSHSRKHAMQGHIPTNNQGYRSVVVTS